MTPTVRRAAERACFGLAFVCLGTFAAGKGQAWLFEHRERARLTAAAGEGLPVIGSPSPAVSPRLLRHSALPGRAWGRIEIPRLGVDALVAEGVDAATLRVAVGHVPDTAFPDEVGNVALAGHRDTVFRPLRELQPGDVVTVTTPLGVFSYEVEQIRIVAPHETEVIAPVPERVLTLVTCYPFGYVGPAPQRYVVRARFAQPLPASQPAL